MAEFDKLHSIDDLFDTLPTIDQDPVIIDQGVDDTGTIVHSIEDLFDTLPTITPGVAPSPSPAPLIDRVSAMSALAPSDEADPQLAQIKQEMQLPKGQMGTVGSYFESAIGPLRDLIAMPAPVEEVVNPPSDLSGVIAAGEAAGDAYIAFRKGVTRDGPTAFFDFLADTSRYLDEKANTIARLTRLPKGGLFKNLSEALRSFADLSRRSPEEIAANVDTLPERFAHSMGTALSNDLPQLMGAVATIPNRAMAFGSLGAFHEVLHGGGPLEIGTAFIRGVFIDKAFQATSILKGAHQAGAMAAYGAADATLGGAITGRPVTFDDAVIAGTTLGTFAAAGHLAPRPPGAPRPIGIGEVPQHVGRLANQYIFENPNALRTAGQTLESVRYLKQRYREFADRASLATAERNWRLRETDPAGRDPFAGKEPPRIKVVEPGTLAKREGIEVSPGGAEVVEVLPPIPPNRGLTLAPPLTQVQSNRRLVYGSYLRVGTPGSVDVALENLAELDLAMEQSGMPANRREYYLQLRAGELAGGFLPELTRVVENGQSPLRSSAWLAEAQLNAGLPLTQQALNNNPAIARLAQELGIKPSEQYANAPVEIEQLNAEKYQTVITTEEQAALRDEFNVVDTQLRQLRAGLLNEMRNGGFQQETIELHRAAQLRLMSVQQRAQAYLDLGNRKVLTEDQRLAFPDLAEKEAKILEENEVALSARVVEVPKLRRGEVRFYHASFLENEITPEGIQQDPNTALVFNYNPGVELMALLEAKLQRTPTTEDVAKYGRLNIVQRPQKDPGLYRWTKKQTKKQKDTAVPGVVVKDTMGKDVAQLDLSEAQIAAMNQAAEIANVHDGYVAVGGVYPVSASLIGEQLVNYLQAYGALPEQLPAFGRELVQQPETYDDPNPPSHYFRLGERVLASVGEGGYLTPGYVIQYGRAKLKIAFSDAVRSIEIQRVRPYGTLTTLPRANGMIEEMLALGDYVPFYAPEAAESAIHLDYNEHPQSAARIENVIKALEESGAVEKGQLTEPIIAIQLNSKNPLRWRYKRGPIDADAPQELISIVDLFSLRNYNAKNPQYIELIKRLPGNYQDAAAQYLFTIYNDVNTRSQNLKEDPEKKEMYGWMGFDRYKANLTEQFIFTSNILRGIFGDRAFDKYFESPVIVELYNRPIEFPGDEGVPERPETPPAPEQVEPVGEPPAAEPEAPPAPKPKPKTKPKKERQVSPDEKAGYEIARKEAAARAEEIRLEIVNGTTTLPQITRVSDIFKKEYVQFENSPQEVWYADKDLQLLFSPEAVEALHGGLSDYLDALQDEGIASQTPEILEQGTRESKESPYRTVLGRHDVRSAQQGPTKNVKNELKFVGYAQTSNGLSAILIGDHGRYPTNLSKKGQPPMQLLALEVPAHLYNYIVVRLFEQQDELATPGRDWKFLTEFRDQSELVTKEDSTKLAEEFYIDFGYERWKGENAEPLGHVIARPLEPRLIDPTGVSTGTKLLTDRVWTNEIKAEYILALDNARREVRTRYPVIEPPITLRLPDVVKILDSGGYFKSEIRDLKLNYTFEDWQNFQITLPRLKEKYWEDQSWTETRLPEDHRAVITEPTLPAAKFFETRQRAFYRELVEMLRPSEDARGDIAFWDFVATPDFGVRMPQGKQTGSEDKNPLGVRIKNLAKKTKQFREPLDATQFEKEVGFNVQSVIEQLTPIYGLNDFYEVDAQTGEVLGDANTPEGQPKSLEFVDIIGVGKGIDAAKDLYWYQAQYTGEVFALNANHVDFLSRQLPGVSANTIGQTIFADDANVAGIYHVSSETNLPELLGYIRKQHPHIRDTPAGRKQLPEINAFISGVRKGRIHLERETDTPDVLDIRSRHLFQKRRQRTGPVELTREDLVRLDLEPQYWAYEIAKASISERDRDFRENVRFYLRDHWADGRAEAEAEDLAMSAISEMENPELANEQNSFENQLAQSEFYEELVRQTGYDWAKASKDNLAVPEDALEIMREEMARIGRGFLPSDRLILALETANSFKNMRPEDVVEYSERSGRLEDPADYNEQRPDHRLEVEAQQRGGRDPDDPSQILVQGPIQEHTELIAGKPKSGFWSLFRVPKPRTAAESRDLIRRQQIMVDIATRLGVPLRVGKIYRSNTGLILGVHNYWNGSIRLREAQDVPTFAHEVGHLIHGRIFTPEQTLPKSNFLDAAVEAERKGVKLVDTLRDPTELQPFASELEPLATPGDPLSEGFAEFNRLYVTKPAVAQEKAPRFYDFYENALRTRAPEIHSVLMDARQAWQRWENQTNSQQVMSTVETASRKGRGFLSERIGRKHLVDDLDPLAQLEREVYGAEVRNRWGKRVPWSNRDALSSPHAIGALYRNWPQVAQQFVSIGAGTLDFNTQKRNGASLDEVLVNHIPERDLPVFKTYIVARMFDLLEATGRQTVFPLPIEQYRQFIADEGRPGFDEALAEMTDVYHRTLDYWVASGGLKAETAERMKELNWLYVPLNRAAPGDMYGDQQSFARNILNKIGLRTKAPYIKGYDGKQSNLFYRTKQGSELNVLDPIETGVMNIYAIVRMAEQQRVGNALLDVAQHMQRTGNAVLAIAPDMVPRKATQAEIIRVLKKVLPDTSLQRVNDVMKDLEQYDLSQLAAKGKDGKEARQYVLEILDHYGLSETQAKRIVGRIKSQFKKLEAGTATDNRTPQEIGRQLIHRAIIDAEIGQKIPDEVILSFQPIAPKGDFGQNVISIRTGIERYISTAGVRNVKKYEPGEMVHLEVPADVYTALQQLEPLVLDGLLRILRPSAQMLRTGVIANPAFAIANLVLDQMALLINTRYGQIPFISTTALAARMLFDPKKAAQMIERHYASGGALGTLEILQQADPLDVTNAERLARSYNPPLRLNVRRGELVGADGVIGTTKAAGRRVYDIFRHPLQTGTAFAQLLEQATRITESMAAYRAEKIKIEREIEEAARKTAAGEPLTAAERRRMSDDFNLEAELRARTGVAGAEASLWFGKRGSLTGSISAVSAFTMPVWLGSDKAYRQMKDDPTRAFFYTTALGMMAAYAWLSSDDDVPAQSLPAHTRRDNFVFGQSPLTSEQFFALSAEEQARHMEEYPPIIIPAPRDIVAMVKNLTEASLDFYRNDSADGWDEVKIALYKQFEAHVNFIPTGMIGPIEWMLERSIYLNEDLIPHHLEGVEADLQILPTTAQVFIDFAAITKKFTGLAVSPIKLQNAFIQQGGGSARWMLFGADQLMALARNANYGENQEAVRAIARSVGLDDIKMPVRPALNAGEWPVMRRFIGNVPRSQTRQVQKFYEQWYEPATRAYKTFRKKTLTAIGEQLPNETQQEFEDRLNFVRKRSFEENQMMVYFGTVDFVNRSLTEWRKEAQRIAKGDMSAEEKRARRNVIYAEMNAVATQANALLSQMENKKINVIEKGQPKPKPTAAIDWDLLRTLKTD